ncbi:transforming acidic coiled-coil-containing protein 2-like isoform X2 [Physella acuta]|uniref:transforming acidic coiled-coil-containing protein 2-like isoform X2 n=1 Tax=Physella acuta TaxID=109671 RepID=UPI0027DE98A6|nr:transforming acidic coiled-coil-containing protein 2-like isoform X2 [Physella acuta]
MADEGQDTTPSSPPLPKKGSYNLDFDSFDDSINPFQPKAKLSSSPPNKSHIPAPLLDDEAVDPFKPRAKVASSPPTSPKVKARNDIVQPSSEAPGELVDGHLDDCNNSKQSDQVVPKQKKVIKKPKVQSKLKLPKKVKAAQDVMDDIQILMPEKAANEEKAEPSRSLNQSLTDDSLLQQAGGNSTLDDRKDNIPSSPASSEAVTVLRNHNTETDGIKELDNLSQSFSKNGPGNLQDSFNQQERLSDQPSSPQEDKLHHSKNDDMLVKTSPEGKQAKKHPAANALANLQAEPISRGADPKSESSSEDSLFYDAVDYPPVAPTKTKLGQKNSTIMDRGPSQQEGGDNKETVVQLVQEVGYSQVLRYSQSDWNKMKQELELNFQASLLNKERDWSLLLGERDKKITSLEETYQKLKHTNEDMRMVVAEFEKTISQLQAEKEKVKSDCQKSVQTLEGERDQAIEDLQSVESAFSDLHRRYEKSKSIIEGFKRNEEQLKQCVEDLQSKLKKAESKLQSLRSQAEEKLDKANEDIEKIKKSTKQDVVRLEAALKKAELRVSSLEESLQNKEKENLELTAICDELISKVGS